MNIRSRRDVLVFISGPLTPRSEQKNHAAEYLEHVRKMAEVGARLMWYGFSVYCPATDFVFFLVGMGQYLEPTAVYENDLRILKSCQAVYALPNITASSAVDKELDMATHRKIPIFREDSEILNHFDKVIRTNGRKKQ